MPEDWEYDYEDEEYDWGKEEDDMFGDWGDEWDNLDEYYYTWDDEAWEEDWTQYED